MNTLLNHSLYVYFVLDNKNISLPERDKNILSQLNEKFKRSEAITLMDKFDVPKRTADALLKSWTKNDILIKISNGNYKKNNY